MRIAILGTRGIPASYGGFETFAEHLSTRLVARGHEVTVYGRAHYISPRQLEYHGVRLEVLPAEGGPDAKPHQKHQNRGGSSPGASHCRTISVPSTIGTMA